LGLFETVFTTSIPGFDAGKIGIAPSEALIVTPAGSVAEASATLSKPLIVR